MFYLKVVAYVGHFDGRSPGPQPARISGGVPSVAVAPQRSHMDCKMFLLNMPLIALVLL